MQPEEKMDKYVTQMHFFGVTTLLLHLKPAASKHANLKGSTTFKYFMSIDRSKKYFTINNINTAQCLLPEVDGNLWVKSLLMLKPV